MTRAAAGLQVARTIDPERQSQSQSRSSAPTMRARDGSVSTLLNLRRAPQVAMCEPALEFDSFGQMQGAASVHNALMQYLTNWYGFPTLKTWDFD